MTDRHAPGGPGPEPAGGPPPGALPGETTGRLLAIPLPALPDVRPGDDLAALIADALRAGASSDPDLAPRPGDVLVVTQKIVSKAEGRIVDLHSVEPRQEAVAFAARWNRDPRQVEVVLRESARIVRMERGVIVSRTAHGYVCANAGVDASNTDIPDLVTLLPEDPDRSAREIRARLADLVGVELAVIVADSFGRPWRWGSPTSRWVSPGSRRSRTSGASPTRPDANSTPPWSRSPTRSAPPPSWPAGRRPGARWSSSGGRRCPPGTDRSSATW